MGPATSRGCGARNGQVLILAAFAVILMSLLAALAIDVGYIMCTRGRLQNAADASCVAGTLELVAQLNDSASEADARAAAEAEVRDIAAANWDAARCVVLFGTYEDRHFVEQDLGTPAAAVQVTTYRDEGAAGGPLALFFAPMMGMDSVNVQKHAVSNFETGIRVLRSGLGPFAVHEDVVVAPGETMKVYWPDMIVPGCFGLLNLDGGSLGTPELNDWILNGYDGEVALGPDGYLWIQGTTGWRAALKSAVEERIGEIMFICIYDEVTGTGSNGLFRIIGFAAVRLTYCNLTGNNPYIDGILERVVSVPDGETGGPMYNLCKVQLVE